jgi:hypothetical protein
MHRTFCGQRLGSPGKFCTGLCADERERRPSLTRETAECFYVGLSENFLALPLVKAAQTHDSSPLWGITWSGHMVRVQPIGNHELLVRSNGSQAPLL